MNYITKIISEDGSYQILPGKFEEDLYGRPDIEKREVYEVGELVEEEYSDELGEEFGRCEEHGNVAFNEDGTCHICSEEEE